MKSSSELLGKEILSLNEQIKESEEAMSKATSLRQKEKKENTLAIKDRINLRHKDTIDSVNLKVLCIYRNTLLYYIWSP